MVSWWIPCHAESTATVRVSQAPFGPGYTVLGVFGGGRALGQCQYSVEIIQAPDCGILGTPATIGVAINSLGHVVGYQQQCGNPVNTEGFLWTPENGYQILPRPAGVTSLRCWDINDAGTIVGTLNVTTFGHRGFVYEDGEFTILPPVFDGVPGPWSEANAINNAGIIVGSRSITKDLNPWSAFMWSKEDGFTDLGVGSGPSSFGLGISDSGVVVGSVGSSSASLANGFVNDSSGFTELPDVPGGTSSYAAAISHNSVIAVTGNLILDDEGNEAVRAFIWRKGVFTSLGTLPGHLRSGAIDISFDGSTVVGLASNVNGNPNVSHGFIWQRGEMFDMNTLAKTAGLVEIDACLGINYQGKIVAAGADGGHVITVVLAPLDLNAGDINADCRVDFDDLSLLFAYWGECGGLACVGDVDESGTVDISDLFILFSNWS